MPRATDTAEAVCAHREVSHRRSVRRGHGQRTNVCRLFRRGGCPRRPYPSATTNLRQIRNAYQCASGMPRATDTVEAVFLHRQSPVTAGETVKTILHERTGRSLPGGEVHQRVSAEWDNNCPLFAVDVVAIGCQRAFPAFGLSRHTDRPPVEDNAVTEIGAFLRG